MEKSKKQKEEELAYWQSKKILAIRRAESRAIDQLTAEFTNKANKTNAVLEQLKLQQQRSQNDNAQARPA